MPIHQPISLNHAAYPTFDTGATYRFYTELLGCTFVAAVRKDVVPSTGAPTPFLHTFFALSSGECIAFFEVEGLEEPADDGVPPWIRHIALTMESPDAVTETKNRLEQAGIDVIGVVNHDDLWHSIYFFDPNGIRVELTHQARPLGPEDAVEGRRLLDEWVAEHGQSLTTAASV